VNLQKIPDKWSVATLYKHGKPVYRQLRPPRQWLYDNGTALQILRLELISQVPVKNGKWKYIKNKLVPEAICEFDNTSLPTQESMEDFVNRHRFDIQVEDDKPYHRSCSKHGHKCGLSLEVIYGI